MEGGTVLQDSLARDLLLCSQCSQYYRQPRMLPTCQHSFCTQCLLDYHELCRVKLGVTQLRTIVCPLCERTSVLPTSGIHALPEDQRAAKIKDLIELTAAERLVRQRFQDLSVQPNNGDDDDDSSSTDEDCSDDAVKRAASPLLPSSNGHNGVSDKIGQQQQQQRKSSFTSTTNGHSGSKDGVSTSSSAADSTHHRRTGNSQSDERNSKDDKSQTYSSIHVVVDDDEGYEGIGVSNGGATSPSSSSRLGSPGRSGVVADSMDDGDAYNQQGELAVCDIRQQTCRYGVRWSVEMHDHGMPSSAAFLPGNGGLVVAEYGNSALVFYDATGNLVRKMDGLKPFSVTVDRDGYVVVGDRKDKTLKIFETSGEQLAAFERNSFKWIGGICQNAAGDYIIMDRSTYKISTYTGDGVKVRAFGSSPSLLSSSKVAPRDDQFCMADFIAVDSHDRIIVCDSGSHCMRVFDQNGKFLMKFGERGSGDGAFEWPKGLCVDALDNVLVADERNKRIAKFSPSGQFIEHVIECSHPFNLAHDRGNPAGSLALMQCSLSGVSKVTVFDYDL